MKAVVSIFHVHYPLPPTAAAAAYPLPTIVLRFLGLFVDSAPWDGKCERANAEVLQEEQVPHSQDRNGSALPLCNTARRGQVSAHVPD